MENEMSKARLQAMAIGGSPDDVEQLFYEALRRGDLGLLMQCWAEDEDIVCILPGDARKTGAGAVHAAFATHLSQWGAVTTQQLHRVDSLASAVHHQLEHWTAKTPEALPQRQYRVVTNVFHKTPQGWRMVAHHASLATADDVAVSLAAPATLH
mgnify:CR=1 FL=1